jgi:DUF1365 family protein
VKHRRFGLIPHEFKYRLFLVALDLTRLDHAFQNSWTWSTTRPALAWFRRADHIGDPQQALDESIRQLVEQSGRPRPSGKIVLLTHLRYWGLIFNPVSFYFCFNSDGEWETMVAEVSNTPWNERHHYLVDLKTQSDTEKAFFVSPFNPMSMTYKWRIARPGENTFTLTLSCWQAQKEFSASLSLSKVPLNSSTLKRVVWSTPSMTIKSVLGIYWQALKLWMKKTPIYKHSIVEQQETK